MTGPTPASVTLETRTGYPRRDDAGTIISWWTRVPVVHAFRYHGRYTETRCGWPASGQRLPLAHVLRIGRPCRLCWREEPSP